MDVFILTRSMVPPDEQLSPLHAGESEELTYDEVVGVYADEATAKLAQEQDVVRQRIAAWRDNHECHDSQRGGDPYDASLVEEMTNDDMAGWSWSIATHPVHSAPVIDVRPELEAA